MCTYVSSLLVLPSLYVIVTKSIKYLYMHMVDTNEEQIIKI